MPGKNDIGQNDELTWSLEPLLYLKAQGNISQINAFPMIVALGR